ncbi:hypothetical protein [Trichlorobacter ammonificans]|uniref:Uncharacterized protein n=1 Tax=Trichlorobacter ammonificans TaxID=2916410 RepID=A0ABM9DBL1_9BACT|nr:hypothetical protein [Trichlorobacter ammonificans]CAH2031787.1 conserved protein of unknown function [Trichlorobacter ammonificans]
MVEPLLLFARELSNGLRVELWDVSRHYFGGYWQVALEARCPVALRPELFDGPAACDEARHLLGECVMYVQRLERMAVRQDLLEPVRRELVQRFEHHVVPFLSHPRFAAGFIAGKSAKCRRKVVRGIPVPA